MYNIIINVYQEKKQAPKSNNSIHTYTYVHMVLFIHGERIFHKLSKCKRRTQMSRGKIWLQSIATYTYVLVIGEYRANLLFET